MRTLETTTTTTTTTTATAPIYNSYSHYYYYDYGYLFLLVAGEICMSYVIVTFVAYTEIDYQAYMEQCYLFLQKNVRDYYLIRGQTGPLVYPAGFLYLYSTLQYLTGYTATVSNTSTSSTGDAVVTDGIHHHHHNSNNNNNEHAVRMAQYIFILFYAATQCLVFFIYYHSTTRILQQSPSSQPQRSYSIWKFRSVLLLLCLSKRLHSIYVLRLFNDGVTMLFLYASMYLLIRAAARPTQQQQQTLWNWGCVVFSLAVSIKMNVLLFAPGLLLLLLHVSDSWTHCIVRIIGYCGIPQLLLGFPFLRQHPVHYIHKAFEFDRTFFYIWTVNWKFLPEDIFVSKPLSILLLLCHVGTLIYMAHRWIQSIAGGNASIGQPRRSVFFINHHHANPTTQTGPTPHKRLSAIYITSTMLTSNFIGIVFARTLHYQFYSWYYHAIPFLLFCNDIYNETMDHKNARDKRVFSYPIPIRIAIMICIEMAFLTFPATPYSSFMLQISHLLILLQIRPPPYHLFLCPDEEDERKLTPPMKKVN